MIKPYAQCATRLENRAGHPPTRAYVDSLVEGLLASGVEASWHSAVDHHGRPLFPSRVFPVSHPEANIETFRYLIDRLHSIGRPVLSWYPLNLGGGVLPVHPDWAMQFYRPEGTTSDPQAERHYVCINSPYGELLPQFVAEVVRDVGFDGIWFDGSTLANHNCQPPFSQAGCRCGFCRERYWRETGLDLPERPDPADHRVRRWINWRYDVLMDLWRRCVEAVRDANPAATVCFNNYRRRWFGSWTTAIPLRRLNLDALLSTELDGFPGQGDIQMKINQAYGFTRGVESWWPLCDHWNIWVPDHEPLTAVQAVLGCIAAGGVASTGVGVEPRQMAHVLGAMETAAAPRLPYVGGETVPYAAILASQQTMDFGVAPMDAWDGIHGANEFCRHAHLQSSVVFDDALESGELQRYPVLLLGNAACLSRPQAEGLAHYVERGGVLVACHEVGTRDELGDPHPVPVLDALLGIRQREAGQGAPTLQIVDPNLAQDCGSYVTFKAPHTLAQPQNGVILLALTADRLTGSWDGLEDEPQGRPARRSPGLWLRPVGQGHVLYAGVDLFKTYLRAPTNHMLRMIRAILTRLRTPQVTARAPLCVTVNTRRQGDGRWAVHLHNAPGSAYAYPTPPGGTYLHTPGEVIPVHDVLIELSQARVRTARSGVTGESFSVSAGRHIHVPRLELHDVVLLELSEP